MDSLRDYLVEKGILEPVRVHATTRRKIKKICCEIFRWHGIEEGVSKRDSENNAHLW